MEYESLSYGDFQWGPYHKKSNRSLDEFFSRYTKYNSIKEFYKAVSEAEGKSKRAPYWEVKEPNEYGRNSLYKKSLLRREDG